MNKFLVVFLTLCIIGQTQAAKFRRLSKSSSRRRLIGDLHHKHRRLSKSGQLKLKVDGRGYFQYRLRVQPTDAHMDDSQYDQEHPVTGHNGAGGPTWGEVRPNNKELIYDQAYSETSKVQVKNVVTNGDGIELVKSVELRKNQRISIITWDPQAADPKYPLDNAGNNVRCNIEGSYTVREDYNAAVILFKVQGHPLNKDSLMPGSSGSCYLVIHPNQNDGAHAGLPDAQGVEEQQDGDSTYFSQVVYSLDGSLHINKYGYLCDDNGLLLVSDGSSRTADPNAKHHIHIPSRADNILVTPTGKVMAVELGGASFTKVGQIKLARFENPQGLNVRLKMKSNCNAANEDGFALGNWCVGTELDGKQHTYMSETTVSGPGIVGRPGQQGFGRIVR